MRVSSANISIEQRGEQVYQAYGLGAFDTIFSASGRRRRRLAPTTTAARSPWPAVELAARRNFMYSSNTRRRRPADSAPLARERKPAPWHSAVDTGAVDRRSDHSRLDARRPDGPGDLLGPQILRQHCGNLHSRPLRRANAPSYRRALPATGASVGVDGATTGHPGGDPDGRSSAW